MCRNLERPVSEQNGKLIYDSNFLTYLGHLIMILAKNILNLKFSRSQGEKLFDYVFVLLKSQFDPDLRFKPKKVHKMLIFSELEVKWGKMGYW